MTLPPRSPRLPIPCCPFDLDCGTDLVPGVRVVARGLVEAGRSRDDLTSRDSSGNALCRMVLLVYECVADVTSGRPRPLDVTYAADVPLPWSTGGSGPDGLGGPGGHEGEWEAGSCVSESGPWPVPDDARTLTFWLRGPDASTAAGTVVVNLVTGEATWSVLPRG